MKTTKRQKELVEQQLEEIRLRQGRSKRQVENNEKLAFISTMGLGMILLGMIIYGLLTSVWIQ